MATPTATTPPPTNTSRPGEAGPVEGDLVLIQTTADATRTRAIHAAIARILAVDPGVRPENVFVSLVEVSAET